MLCHFIFSFLLIFLEPFSAFAAEENNVERIQVTGSRIKRINIEGPSPLLVLDKEDLENSGYNSVADVLRDTTIAPFGVGREEAGNSASGESSASVHSSPTLILINGQRVIVDPHTESVDLNLIPIYAVERVEIIKDGSSAIYGSDALGGVINFIMKKNFSGTEVYGRASPSLWPLYKGGGRFEGAAVWGNTYSKGSVTGVLQIRFNDSIVSSDRKWSDKRFSNKSPHPAFTNDQSKEVIVATSCPEKLRRAAYCEFNFSKYIHTLPLITQLSGYFQGNYKWNGVNFYSQILPSYKITRYIFPPMPGGALVGAGHQLSFQTGVPGTVDIRFMEANNRRTRINYLTLDTTFGAKGYLSSNWDWDFRVKASGTSKNSTNSGLIIKDTIARLMYEGIYDPFTPPGSGKRNLKEALYTAKNKNTSLLFLADTVFSGNIGVFDLALGAQTFYIKYVNNVDDNTNKILNAAGSDGSGSRKVVSAYGELAFSPLNSLEFQVAGRADQYSDFGFTANPKVAFRYQPFDSFLLRGSIGTSFIAPSLHVLYGKKSEGFPHLFDSVACFNELKAKGDIANLDENLVKDFISDQKETIERKDLSEESKAALKTLLGKINSKNKQFCSHKQFKVVVSSNRDLKEIKGLSASLGSVIQFNNNISFTLDGWYIKTDGSPSSGIGDDVIKVEMKKGSKFVSDKGLIINRDGNNPFNPILRSQINKKGLPGIESKLLNIGSSKISGLDFALSAFPPKLSYRGGNVYFKEEGTIVLYTQSEGFPGRGFKDNIGKAGLPRWRNIGTIGWQNKKHNIALKMNSFASVTKATNELQSLPMHHRFDLSYQWAMDSKTVLNAGWFNLLFDTPPIDDTIVNGIQIDDDLYDARGPHFYVGFKRLM